MMDFGGGSHRPGKGGPKVQSSGFQRGTAPGEKIDLVIGEGQLYPDAEGTGGQMGLRRLGKEIGGPSGHLGKKGSTRVRKKKGVSFREKLNRPEWYLVGFWCCSGDGRCKEDAQKPKKNRGRYGFSGEVVRDKKVKKHERLGKRIKAWLSKAIIVKNDIIWEGGKEAVNQSVQKKKKSRNRRERCVKKQGAKSTGHLGRWERDRKVKEVSSLGKEGSSKKENAQTTEDTPEGKERP